MSSSGSEQRPPGSGDGGERRPRALARAEADVAAGNLWKARDRLDGLLAQRPADQEVLGLLGDVSFRMGDLPAAGRYWFLTERSGADVEQAVAAMYERHGRGPLPLLNVLPVKPPLDAYPPLVHERLRRLVDGVDDPGEFWLSKARRLKGVEESPMGAVGGVVVAFFAGV